jgi:hypothetical protein
MDFEKLIASPGVSNAGSLSEGKVASIAFSMFALLPTRKVRASERLDRKGCQANAGEDHTAFD